MRKKQGIFYLIFSLSFVIYAASPFLYTREYRKTLAGGSAEWRLFVDLLLASRPDNEPSTGLKPQGFHNIRKNKIGDDDSYPVHILLKKKRATLSLDDSDIFEKTGKNICAAASFHALPEVSYAIKENDGARSGNDFQHTHSGLSPPSA